MHTVTYYAGHTDFHSTKSTNFLLQAIIAQTILILGWDKLPT